MQLAKTGGFYRSIQTSGALATRNGDSAPQGGPAASSGVITYVLDSCLPRAVGAAIETIFRLDAVADDLAPAMITHRRELMDRTLETIERVTRSGSHHLERQIIIVPANFTLCHRRTPLEPIHGSH